MKFTFFHLRQNVKLKQNGVAYPKLCSSLLIVAVDGNSATFTETAGEIYHTILVSRIFKK